MVSIQRDAGFTRVYEQFLTKALSSIFCIKKFSMVTESSDFQKKNVIYFYFYLDKDFSFNTAERYKNK